MYCPAGPAERPFACVAAPTTLRIKGAAPDWSRWPQPELARHRAAKAPGDEQTTAPQRIKQVIAVGRKLGLRIEFALAGRTPPAPVRSAKARRELIQQMARVQP